MNIPRGKLVAATVLMCDGWLYVAKGFEKSHWIKPFEFNLYIIGGHVFWVKDTDWIWLMTIWVWKRLIGEVFDRTEFSVRILKRYNDICRWSRIYIVHFNDDKNMFIFKFYFNYQILGIFKIYYLKFIFYIHIMCFNLNL